MTPREKRDISKMIRRGRIALGLTQEQFAVKVGVTFTTVNRWENNKARPSPLAIRRIKELQKRTGQVHF
jgi:putative transcriptional regulator